MNILIPMAGVGDRFNKAGFTDPKPLINVISNPMIKLAVKSLGLDGQFFFIVNNKIDRLDSLKNVLLQLSPTAIVIEVDYLTEGPVSTCLLAKEFIDSESPLVIANCDQIMEWDSKKFLSKITNTEDDGIVVTYNVITEKNSYVKTDELGYAVEFAEKKIISDKSLNGIHYWKRGSDFVRSAKSMISKNIRVNNEFYIAPTYNELLLEGKKITTYDIDIKEHWAVGTPEDLEKYINHIYEKI